MKKRPNKSEDFIDTLVDKTDPELIELHARMDVGNKLAKEMGDLGLSAHGLSKASGLNRQQIWRTLSGDANLGINSMVRMFAALGLRVDFVVTNYLANEWETKRAIRRLEARVNRSQSKKKVRG